MTILNKWESHCTWSGGDISFLDDITLFAESLIITTLIVAFIFLMNVV